MPLTNRGRTRLLELALANEFNGGTAPTNFYFALVTATTAPTADTDTLGDLTEIAAGNGYATGGVALARSATGFDLFTIDDTNDRGEGQAADVVIGPASGGAIPASGNPIRYLVWLDDNVTVNSREVLGWVDITGSTFTIPVGVSLNIQDLLWRLAAS